MNTQDKQREKQLQALSEEEADLRKKLVTIQQKRKTLILAMMRDPLGYERREILAICNRNLTTIARQTVWNISKEVEQ